MQPEHSEIECYYLADKPDRDKVREKVWAKIETVDDAIKKTYNSLEEFQKEIRENDSGQDRHIEELKAMIQEIGSSQHESDEEIQQIKLQIGTLRSDIADLRTHLDNGYTEKLSTNITDRLLSILEMMNNNNFKIKKTTLETESEKAADKAAIRKMRMEKTFEVLIKLLTTGGVLYLLLSKLL